MKVFFDTNVLLDIALARKPFVEASMAAWAMVVKSAEKPLIAQPRNFYLARSSRLPKRHRG